MTGKSARAGGGDSQRLRAALDSRYVPPARPFRSGPSRRRAPGGAGTQVTGPAAAVRRRPSPAPAAGPLDLPALIARIATASARPRYTFMVLNLIARAAGPSGSAGPHVREDGRNVPVRDWPCDALVPLAQRDARRRAIVGQVRRALERAGALPLDPDDAARRIEEEVRARVRRSGRCNVSRAVSDLVRAGLLRRHYQGYRVDHENRGAQREAVYTIVEQARDALGTA